MTEDTTFGYRKLIVWQKAKQLVRLVYAEVKKLPAEERYALSDQIRRAVVSIPSNIAEGTGRASNRDYGHFLSIARGSLYETINQLEIAQDLGYIEADSLTKKVAVKKVVVDKKVEVDSCSCRKESNFHSTTTTSDYDSLTPAYDYTSIESLAAEVGRMLTALMKKYSLHSTTTTSDYN